MTNSGSVQAGGNREQIQRTSRIVCPKKEPLRQVSEPQHSPESAVAVDRSSRQVLGIGGAVKVQAENRKRPREASQAGSVLPTSSLDKKRRDHHHTLLALIAQTPFGREMMAKYDLKNTNTATLKFVLKQVMAGQAEQDRIQARIDEQSARNEALKAQIREKDLQVPTPS